jgi:hypothetical protein
VQRVRTPSQEAARVDAGDPQKAALYAWEDSWPAWGNNDLTLQGCRDAVLWACRRYDVPAPRVKQHHSEAMSECDVVLGVIDFQAKARRAGRGGKNAAVALHEAAHWIVFQRHDMRPQDHGPTFLGVYLQLLAGYGVAPMVALHATARKFKLRWT